MQGIPQYEKLFLGEILIAVLETRLMGMLGHMEVSCLGKETVEELHFWTLL